MPAYRDYTITRTDNGNDRYTITRPCGAVLAMPARSLEAAKVRVDCIVEKRMPTREEEEIMYPSTPPPVVKRRRCSIVYSFGNRIR